MKKLKKPVALITLFATLSCLVSPITGKIHHKNKKVKKVNNFTAGIATDLKKAKNTSIKSTIATLQENPIELVSVPKQTSEDSIEETTIHIEETQTESLHTIQVDSIEYPVSDDSGFKSWMPSIAITDKTSNQFKLQQIAYTDSETGIRMVDGRYCIAVGSYYTTTIGTYIDLTLENGIVLECILADCKANEDTNADNRIHKIDKSLVEFIVDKGKINHKVSHIYGDISYAKDGWNSKVVSIKIYS